MNVFKTHPNVVSSSSKKEDGNMSFEWGEESDVLQNRKAFLEKHNLQLEDCIVMQVEHEEEIVRVQSSDKNSVVVAEALITNEKNLTLFLLTADCLPISVYDPTNHVIALVHLGWRPTNLLVIRKVIEELTQTFRSKPSDLIAHIGPGIHKESYVFGDPIQKTLPAWRPFLEETPSGETAIDLVAYNKAQMVASGLLEENISVDPVDTAASDAYFSHYRSTRTGKREGRFATVISLQ